MAQQARNTIRVHGTSLRKRMWRDRYLYMLLVPVVVFFIVFKYAPLYGLQIAFKD